MITKSDLEFLECALTTECVLDAYYAILKCNMYFHIKYKEQKSFMFSNDPQINLIKTHMKLYLHSGSSFGWTMRTVESIIKNGLYNYKYRYLLKNNKDEYVKKIEAIYLIQNTFKKCLSDPNYRLCRDRLRNEYEHLISLKD